MRTHQARITEIKKILARAKQPEPLVGFTVERIKKDLHDKLYDLLAVLTSEPLLGKQIIRKHIKKITLTPGQLDGKRVFYVDIDFDFGGGNSGVLLTGSMDASMQQYGFSTITVTGLTLDTSRVRRKPVALNQTAANGGSVPVSLTPTAEALVPTQASDSAALAKELLDEAGHEPLFEDCIEVRKHRAASEQPLLCGQSEENLWI